MSSKLSNWMSAPDNSEPVINSWVVSACPTENNTCFGPETEGGHWFVSQIGNLI